MFRPHPTLPECKNVQTEYVPRLTNLNGAWSLDIGKRPVLGKVKKFLFCSDGVHVKKSNEGLKPGFR